MEDGRNQKKKCVLCTLWLNNYPRKLHKTHSRGLSLGLIILSLSNCFIFHSLWRVNGWPSDLRALMDPCWELFPARSSFVVPRPSLPILLKRLQGRLSLETKLRGKYQFPRTFINQALTVNGIYLGWAFCIQLLTSPGVMYLLMLHPFFFKPSSVVCSNLECMLKDNLTNIKYK